MASSLWPNRALFSSFIFMVLVKTLKGVPEARAPESQSLGCATVKYAYKQLGFNTADVPSQPISGHHLDVCAQGFTCCTADMENKLGDKSKQDFDKVMGDKIGLLRMTFISRTAKFDTFFTELLDNSKQDLHNMFVRTYGLLYQQNSYIFTDLFEDLRSYYKGSDINLLDVLDNFFMRLFEKMFILLNQSYKFDDSFLECLTDSMAELKPFKDVPPKLSVKVKRAFIAARTFVQGLSVGRDVVIAVSKIEPSQSCLSALMKMQYCQHCKGKPYGKPCNNYCMNVMKGCLAFHADLNFDWNRYIDALMKLADRLEGPFNIESVVDPIDIKISDAIMNFQETSETINQRVFQGCGRPELRSQRTKRREAAAASSYDEYNYFGKFDRKEYVKPTTAAGTSLDRLVRDIKEKVETAKDFFKNLPNTVCNEKAAKIFNEECWNGVGLNDYMPEVMKDGVAAQLNNPEVDVDIRKPNTIINQQIIQLKVITNKLSNAYNGLDVDWIDTESALVDDEDGASGSGSGSGSGDDSHDDQHKSRGRIGGGGRNRNEPGDHYYDKPTRFPPSDITYKYPYDIDTNNIADTYGRDSGGASSTITCSNHSLLVLFTTVVSIVLMINTRQLHSFISVLTR